MVSGFTSSLFRIEEMRGAGETPDSCVSFRDYVPVVLRVLLGVVLVTLLEIVLLVGVVLVDEIELVLDVKFVRLADVVTVVVALSSF